MPGYTPVPLSKPEWGTFDKPVVVRRFHNHHALEAFLNNLALEATNRHDLKFLTESNGSYTAVFIFVPKEQEQRLTPP